MLEICVFVSLCSIYLKLCSLLLYKSVLKVVFPVTRLVSKRYVQHIDYVWIPMPIKIMHIQFYGSNLRVN